MGMEGLASFKFSGTGSLVESRPLMSSKTGKQYAHAVKIAVGTFTANVDLHESLWPKGLRLKEGDICRFSGHRQLNYRNEPQDVVTDLEVLDARAALEAQLALLKGQGSTRAAATA